jgi:hypothetical protein
MVNTIKGRAKSKSGKTKKGSVIAIWQIFSAKAKGKSYSAYIQQGARSIFILILTLLYPVSVEGVSDAPLKPANKRVIVVAKSGGNYTSIQAALNASQPGDTIQVKNGTYVEGVRFTRSGTELKPIALVNFPGHSPIINPGERLP